VRVGRVRATAAYGFKLYRLIWHPCHYPKTMMRASVSRGPMDFEALVFLAKSGDTALLGSEMGRRWPDGHEWTPGDVAEAVTLLAFARRAGDASALYRDFSEPVKRHRGATVWLEMLKLQAILIEEYEGVDATLAWLRGQAGTFDEYSAGGYPLALAGAILRSVGRTEEALPLLREAVTRATSGVRWKLTEILGEMGQCQLELGHMDLAFEYFRAFLVQEYMRGKVPGPQLERLCQGIAGLLGQVDFQIELQRNIAQQEKWRPKPIRVIAWGSAAGEVAMIGDRDEARAALERAAVIADESESQVGQSMGPYCRTLARLLDSRVVSAHDVETAIRDTARVFGKSLPIPGIDDISGWLAMQRDVRTTYDDGAHVCSAMNTNSRPGRSGACRTSSTR
jgi:hypothetical protein